MRINTPPMGWNTWNTFATNINEQLILDSAKIMVSSGLRDAGYNYIVIDDGWCLRQRDENGRLVADPRNSPVASVRWRTTSTLWVSSWASTPAPAI